ncbi:DUF3348 domain-containing protein [Acidovorax sp. HDW3]|uniref:DUF3348 family protein n=1 Tax=Acidovorax sp. HDW3 TaxID=2714923 RepID=UPI00140AAA28|nr:DUF3348 family protein [Acidovorax sp. HDW3]QIL43495.1 DUF3348 domain-containing protein [Acidovorax sp. HDW3]
MPPRTAQPSRLTRTALVRLLARHAPPGQAAPAPALADGLGGWTDWTAAIALAGALERPLAVPLAPLAQRQAQYADLAAVCAAQQAQQAGAIAREAQAVGRSVLDAGLGFAALRQCLVARQQALEQAVAPLRERLRAALAACGPEAARLALVDAVLAQALAPQERRLCAGLQPWLEARYHAQLPEGSADPAALQPLRELLQALLLAELDLRWQPLHGLLAALHSASLAPTAP